MKQLTIEEKAKAYDEAKARMSKAYNSNRCTIGFMNEIFPELKESKDENIRKGLIDYFNNFHLQTFAGLDPKKILAWLEKQGEQEDILEDATLDNNEDGLVADTIKAKDKQKPWSEEDEEHLNSIISDIKTAMGAYPRSQEVIGIYNDEISFLKSLKDRIQPKQEWSEEDETYSDHVITAIKSYYTDDKGEENPWREELLRWFKSLKERLQSQHEYRIND